MMSRRYTVDSRIECLRRLCIVSVKKSSKTKRDSSTYTSSDASQRCQLMMISENSANSGVPTVELGKTSGRGTTISDVKYAGCPTQIQVGNKQIDGGISKVLEIESLSPPTSWLRNNVVEKDA